MVTLRLPQSAPENLQEGLWDDYRVEVPVFEREDGRFIRPSFQGYNDDGDLERLKTALHELL
jgi:hypothetical protein